MRRGGAAVFPRGGQGTPLLVEASGVDYISSIGIRTLLTTARAIRLRGGPMAVVAATEEVAEVLKTTGVDAGISMFATLEEAREAVRIPLK